MVVLLTGKTSSISISLFLMKRYEVVAEKDIIKNRPETVRKKPAITVAIGVPSISTPRIEPNTFHRKIPIMHVKMRKTMS